MIVPDDTPTNSRLNGDLRAEARDDSVTLVSPHRRKMSATSSADTVILVTSSRPRAEIELGGVDEDP